MSLVRYPIAASVEAALSSPLGHAERESEAVRLAGKAVAFVSQDMGPEFDSRDAALEAWREHLTDLPPEDLWRKLRETVAPVSGRMPGPKQLTPTGEAGKRGPAPPRAGRHAPRAAPARCRHAQGPGLDAMRDRFAGE